MNMAEEKKGKYVFALSPRTVLKQRYVIDEVIGVGGFGITYKALDSVVVGEYAIKELLINNDSVREKDGRTVSPYEGKEGIFEHGIQRFIDEARILSGLEDIPNVVRIRDLFQENDTAYFVMEYIKGTTLNTMMAMYDSGHLPFDDAVRIIEKIGRTLDVIYREYAVFHRDLSPENIMVDETGEPQLIDFGTAKIYMRNQCQVHSIVLKPGFAPPEQYTGTNQGPWTDIYSLAGVLYFIASGIRIPPSPDRLAGEEYIPLSMIVPECSKRISDIIDNALMLNPNERIQKMGDFIAVLETGAISRHREPVISVKYENGEGDIWRIPEDMNITVGRTGGKNNISVSRDSRISGQHCIIRYKSDTGDFEVTDVSTNGVYLKGSRFIKNKCYRIKPGSLLILGERICGIELGVR